MDQWHHFLSRCLATRLDSEDFKTFVQILSTKHPLTSRQIANVFLQPRPENDILPDVRVPQYLFILIDLELVDLADILRNLGQYSSFQPPQPDTKNSEGEGKRAKRWKESYSIEEGIVYKLAKIINQGTRPKTAHDAVEVLKALTAWLGLMVTAGATNDIMQSLGTVTDDTEGLANGVRQAFGTLLLAVAQNPIILKSIGKGCPKEIRTSFNQALATFISSILQISPAIAERLNVFQTQTLASLEPVDKKQREANAEINQIMDSMGTDTIPVTDAPVVNSRAGLYIYINALLVGRPIVDDQAMYAYLHNRYQGDIQTTTVDLILASFDVLSNAIFRNEKPQTIFILRSFLINKLPILLTVLTASMFPPLTPEFCITAALSQVDTNAFPTFSAMFDDSSSSNMISESVRQEFCFACCLHGLIAEERIESLLGEVPMQTLPTGGRYVKENLVQQCLNDPERAEGLVDELDKMEGNAGAVSQALVETIGHLCMTKETMSLKNICSHLARKPSSLDVLLLFNRPQTILQPICNLLDSWRYDEDQGEYQPVYEEFGSIALLVLALVHRYDLNGSDIGPSSNNSFVSKLLEKNATSRSLSDLSDAEKGHLDGWIRGLFDADGGGLGDELMSSCPPQDFYLLVPKLFHQIVLAFMTHKLSEESLKNGLEYLVDTFLLPSLIPSINFLSTLIWTNSNLAPSILTILHPLLIPTSISTEASTMLSSILNIIARPLDRSLHWLQRQEPSRQNISPLINALKPHLGFERIAATDHTEMEAWTTTPNGGLLASVRATMQALIQWGLNPGINITPASYTHRQILFAVKHSEAKHVLLAIVNEVKSHRDAGNSEAVCMDVATALICAPDIHSLPPLISLNTIAPAHQNRLNLRDALRLAMDNVGKLHKKDVLTAETLIRLSRRVEALGHVSQSAIMDEAINAVGAEGFEQAVQMEGMMDQGFGLDDGEDLLGGMKMDI